MKIIFYIILLLVIGFGIVYGFNNFMQNKSKNDITLVKSYIYREQLTTLGYSEELIGLMRSKFTDYEIKSYLLEKKYDSLMEYKSSKIFNIEHLDRYVAYDEKNEYKKNDVVTYVEIGLDYDFYSHIKEIKNYNDSLVLINKYNKLPNNYNIDNLTKINPKYSNKEILLKENVYYYLKLMINDAKKDNVNLTVISGYRTNDYQKQLFENSIKKNGYNHALMYSAKEGHSEHQTGYAVDLNTTDISFKNTKEYKWLINNSHKYGFIERYQENKEFITGYNYEPWHYRFVGTDHSKIIKANNITLEEYIVLYDFFNKKHIKNKYNK